MTTIATLVLSLMSLGGTSGADLPMDSQPLPSTHTLPTTPPASGTKTVGQNEEPVASGDGETCKTVTLTNNSTGETIQVRCEWGDGTTTGWITLAPGEAHPFVCAFEKITGRCVQRTAAGEETAEIGWEIEQ